MIKKGKKLKENIFSKFYKSLDSKYLSLCDWFTKKGINLNKFNDFLESKGIPAFALVGSLFFILIILLLFLVFFGIGNHIYSEFIIQDYAGTSLNNVQVSITDPLTSKVLFTTKVNNNDKLKIPLKVGKEYFVKASKESYLPFSKKIKIVSKEQQIRIVFEENYETGVLKVRVIDSSNNKLIIDANVSVSYFVNGEEQEKSGVLDTENNISMEVPKNKELSILVSADSYQDKKLNLTLDSDEQLQEVTLDSDNYSFEGLSKLTFIVVGEDGSPIEGAAVDVYNELNEQLGVEVTDAAGKALIEINTGETIHFSISKNKYKTINSLDDDISYKIIDTEKTITKTLELGGTKLSINVMDELATPLENVEVNLYDISGDKIDSNLTGYDGTIRFTGLSVDSDVVVTACKEDYFCTQKIVSIQNTDTVSLELEKITPENSRVLYVFVVDGSNQPIDNAKINVFKVVDSEDIPYGLPTLLVDATGSISFPVKLDEDLLVYGYAGDSNDSKYIKISSTKENKVILTIEQASRKITLELKDLQGNRITEGNLVIKAKDNTVLYSGNIDESGILLNTKGYKDLTLEYTDLEGNQTTSSLTVGEDDFLSTTIRPENTGNYPSIDFVGIEDLSGKRTNFVTSGKEYYLLFDILFPDSVKSGGINVRAGPDTETDSENMSYGITGFKADTKVFRYSTTYTPTPKPGSQSIDILNEGSSGEINKWIELNWRKSEKDLGNKQIKIKIKAIDSSQFKLYFKYRAWANLDNKVYRDPIDETLGENISSSEKQTLYANTKEVSINLFDVPANCNNDVCVSYQFIDNLGFKFSKDDFFAIKDNIYAIEATLFSFKNKELNLEADTSVTAPIISFISTSDTLSFPLNVNYASLSELKLKKDNISLKAGERKKVYLYFIAKDLGVSYIETKFTGSDISPISNKFSFKIQEKKQMSVILTPSNILPYGDSLTIDVKDSIDQTPIENAFIKIKDGHNQFITSLKGSKLNGVNGKYIFNNKFVVNKLNIEVDAYGYKTYNTELIVADNSLLLGPDKITVNVGQGKTTETQSFILRNSGSSEINSIVVGTPKWIEGVDGLILDIRSPQVIPGNSSKNFEIIISSLKDKEFTYAKANVPIYGLVGNRQVAKTIEIIINKGRITETCFNVKPLDIDTYVGNKKDSENTLTLKLTNNCDKDLVITPNVIPLRKSNKKNLDIIFPQISLLQGEQKDYEINIKNISPKKQIKNYKYEVVWENPYYNFPTSKLNIKVLDLSKALLATPPIVYVPISQLNKEDPGVAYTRFLVVNKGDVPIRDIQITRDPQIRSANIGSIEHPREINVLMPKQVMPIDITYKVKIRSTALDDMIYTVSGVAKGIKDRVSSKVKVVFVISSPGCIKVQPKELNYSMNLEEEKQRYITFTNKCSGPVTIERIDKRKDELASIFGRNKVSFYQVSGEPVIPVNGTASFALKIFAENYGGIPGMPLRFIGKMPGSNQYVSSESTLLSVDITPKDKDILADLEQKTESEIPICESKEDTAYLDFPIIAQRDNCTGDNGYCDAFGVANLLLKKINLLHKSIKEASAHFNNKVQNSGCSLDSAKKGFCRIEDLGGDVKPLEFSFYMQNDVVSVELLRRLLNNSKYSIKDYYVTVNPGMNPEGVYVTGGKIHLGKIYGCGRYKVKIDGYIATTYDSILSDRVYYFVDVESVTKTDQCKKEIQNFMQFLPLDRDLKKNTNPFTWLTVFTGRKDIAKGVAKNIFKDDPGRYVRTLSSGSKNNHLDVSIADIKENPKAMAKISFEDSTDLKVPKPEQVNLIINKKYAFGKDLKLPEKMVNQATKIISNLINKQEYADVCISKDKDYLLIMSFINVGELTLKPESNDVMLKTSEFCKSFTVKSKVDEIGVLSYNLDLDDPESLMDVGFKFGDERPLYDAKKIAIKLEKDKDVKFKMCFKPKTPNIYKFVDKDITVTVDSIYGMKGKLGRRSADAKLTFKTCGITPKSLLEKVYNKLNSKEGGNLGEYYALVDWNNPYSKQDREKMCTTIEKFQNSHPKANKFFDITEGACSQNLKETKAEKSSKRSRASKNAIAYFGACTAACGTCSFATNIVLGPPGMIKGVAVDCGVFSCGIPAVSIYLAQAENLGIVGGIDKVISYAILGKKDAKPLSNLLKKLGGIISKSATTNGAIGGSVGTVASAVSSGSRLKKIYPYPFEKDPTELLKDVVAPTSTTITVAPTTVAKLPTSVGKRLEKYLNYYQMKGSGLSYEMTVNPADEKILDGILNKIKPTPTSHVDITKLNSLPKSELDDLSRIIGSATYKRLGRGGVLNPSSLSREIADFSAKKFSKGASTTKLINQISKTEYDKMVESLKDAKSQLDLVDVSKIDEELKTLEASKSKIKLFKKARVKELDKQIKLLKDKKNILKQAQSNVDDLGKVLDDIGGTSPSGGVYNLTDDVAKKLTALEAKGPSKIFLRKASKFKSFATGFVRGLVCGGVGNFVGINTLKALNESGAQDNSIILENINNMTFEKNTLYEIDISRNVNSPNNKNKFKLEIKKFGVTGKKSIDDETRLDRCVVIKEKK